jgi:hypothetical protein
VLVQPQAAMAEYQGAAGMPAAAGLPPVAGQLAPLVPQQGAPPAVHQGHAQAQVQQGAIFQAPLRHRTFASLFADPTRDPNHQEAFWVVENFDPTINAPLTAGALKQALIGLTMPVFLCCATLHDNVTKIYVVNSISRYPRALTGRATPWDGQLIGFLGDTVGDMVLNVVLPETLFDEVTDTLVYNAETFAQELPNLALANLFPRVHANAADNATGLQS